MAIAVVTSGNNGADNGGTTSSVSWSFNAQGAGGSSNYALVVQVEGDPNTDDVSGVTYNGVSMTFLTKVVAPGGTVPGRYTYAYGLLGPASGSNTIQVSAGNNHYLFGCAVSYSGVVAFGATNTQTGVNVTQVTGSLITTVDQSWVYAGAAGSQVSSWSGISGATLRGQYLPFSSPAIFDSNAAQAVGSYAMTIGTGLTGNIGMVMVELKSQVGGGGGGTLHRMMTMGVG